MRRSVLVPALIFTLALAEGCAKNGSPAPAAAPSEKKAVSAATGAGVLVPEAPAHGAPLRASAPAAGVVPEAPQPALTSVVGTVEETIDASEYTYLRLKTANGEIWAAVTKTTVRKGEKVTVVNAMSMDGFESKSLNRKFDHLVFGSLGDGKAPAPVSAHASAPGAPHGIFAGGPPDAGDVNVAKAEGKDARTVAQVFAERLSLKDKTVTVRGKVVKSSSGIMGRHWLHIRDGSGSRENKDDDLTVTAADGAAVGDVVVVRGVAHVDRDFGAGYAYPVVLEDAKVAREPAPTRTDPARR